MDTAIVFNCKGCGALFFAALNNPDVVGSEETANEIKDYLISGHKMSEVSTEECRVKLGTCTCLRVSHDSI